MLLVKVGLGAEGSGRNGGQFSGQAAKEDVSAYVLSQYLLGKSSDGNLHVCSFSRENPTDNPVVYKSHEVVSRVSGSVML